MYLIVIITVVLIGFLFSSINQHVTELNLLIIRTELRVVDIALIFLLLGISLGLLVSLLFSLQRKTSNWLKNSSE